MEGVQYLARRASAIRRVVSEENTKYNKLGDFYNESDGVFTNP